MRLAMLGLLAALVLLTAPCTGEAQSQGKIPRIGILWFGSPVGGPSPHLEAFRHALHERGYVEGQNIAVESRHAAMRVGVLPDMVSNLVLFKVDVIVAVGDAAISAARHATSTIPIVMVPSADPVGLEVRSPDEFESAFAALTREHAEALLVLGDPLILTHRIRIVDLVAKGRLPAMYDLREFVEAGGLMAYGPSLPDLFKRAAYYVDRILKGAKPGDLPVEQPAKFELVVNLKTTKTLACRFPIPAFPGKRGDPVVLCTGWQIPSKHSKP